MELADSLRFVAALGIVLAGIFGLAWGLRRLGIAHGLVVQGARLEVIETRALDTRRRLVLVRRDGVGHLLLLGAGADLLIETGIPLGEAEGEATAPRTALRLFGGGIA